MRTEAASAGTVGTKNRIEYKKKHFTLKDVTDCTKGKIEDEKK